MPIYVYECPKCKVKEQCIERMTEHSDHFCRKCSVLMYRIPTKANFTLHSKKGFYGSKPKP